MVLLQFRFYCLLPFITVPIVFLLKLSMYRSESAWSTSLLLIYKKASFCWTYSGSRLKNEVQAVSVLFKANCNIVRLILFCPSTEWKYVTGIVPLYLRSGVFLEKLLVAYAVKKFLIRTSLTTAPYLSHMHPAYLSSYFFMIQISC